MQNNIDIQKQDIIPKKKKNRDWSQAIKLAERVERYRMKHPLKMLKFLKKKSITKTRLLKKSLPSKEN